MKQDKAVEMESFAESIVAVLSAGSPAEPAKEKFD